MIFGFRPHGRNADLLGDFQGDPSKEKEKERKKNFEVLSRLIGSNRAYGAFIGTFMDQKVDYPHGGHVMFLLLWSGFSWLRVSHPIEILLLVL